MYRIPIRNQCQFRPLPLQKDLRRWASLALTPLMPKAWLSISLVDAEEMAALNEQYRAKAAPTNVLSFPLQIPIKQALPILGDLVICPSVVWQEALDQEKTYVEHFCHMVIHGVLHLVGFDHINAEDAAVMESLEIQLLTELNISNPYD